ncbi:MAG: porin [Sneathiellales bacterium]|nr:porin [Sneathiellales bacterium]
MKKIALGTTALVAATALTAGTASAAEKIKLGLGGYLQTSFVAASYDDGDQLPTDIRHEGEVHFTGSTTLDNGLTFGVNIQLEARATGDQVDETYMFVEGAFGRVNVGSENSAAYLMHFASPEPVIAWGLNDPNAEAGGFTTPSTAPTEVSDSDKITYFTPRFSGFQVGASFTPDGDEETGTGASPSNPISDEGAEDEAYSISANYVNTFNGISVKGSLGYDIITSTSSDDIEELSAGLQLGYGGFKVGGAYKLTENEGDVDNQERHDWNLGINYGQGPWNIGVQYARVEFDDATDGEYDAVVIGGNYILGPGVTAFGGVQFHKADDALVGSEGDEATIFFIGTALSF